MVPQHVYEEHIACVLRQIRDGDVAYISRCEERLKVRYSNNTASHTESMFVMYTSLVTCSVDAN